MALTFDANYYLTHRADVFQAFVATGGSTGLTWAQFAEQHYNNHGRFEGANPNAIFKTNEYLAANPDVAAAGVNPFEHYLTHGVYEGRAPNASFPKLGVEFDADAYLAANADLADAGIDTPEEAYAHFVLHGQFENRPGAPEVDSGISGETYTLAPNVENLTGTMYNDKFIGVIDTAANGGTFNTGDSIDGGAGNDTLELIAATAGLTITPASLKNVETIKVQTLNNTKINLSNASGVKTLSSVNSSDSTVEFTSVAAIADIVVGNSDNAAVVVNYLPAVVAGTADEQNITLDNNGGTVAVNAGAGIETFNIETIGANSLNLINAGNTVNVSGSGSIAFDGTLGITTLNASENSGGVTARIGNGAVTVTGGSGDDTFTFGVNLTQNTEATPGDVVDGGEGYDTVIINGGDYTSSTNPTLRGINALTSIEEVRFTGNTNVQINHATLTNADIETISFALANAFNTTTVGNANSDVDYNFHGRNGTATFDMKGGNTVLNIGLVSTDATGTSDARVNGINVNLAGVDAGKVATINLSSTGTLRPAGEASTGIISAASGSTLNVSGDADLRINSVANNMTIDASEFTGDLNVQGSAFTNNATNLGQTGGGGNATVLTKGIDSITLGSGSNVVEFESNGMDSGIIQVVNQGGNFVQNGNILHDVITGFTAGNGGDVLDILTVNATYTALAANIQNEINALSGTNATLLEAANLAADGNGVAGWTAFSFQGETYALYEANADTANGFTNADTLVKLVGVEVADLVAANFA